MTTENKVPTDELKTHIVGLFPDEKSEREGIKRVATSIDAKNIEHAKAKANFLFLEEYEHAQSAAYRMLVCEDGPHIAHRPPRGIWDTEYLYTYDWPEDIGYPILRDAGPVSFDALSTQQRIAVLVKYDSTEIQKSDLPAAYALFQDEAGTFEGHVVEAICRTPDIANMYPERIQHAIGWVGAKCEHTAKWPEIQKELLKWQKRMEENRKASAPSKSIVEIAREKAAQEKMMPGVNKDKSAARPKRTYKHTYQTLDQEVAIYLWPGDVNPGNVDGEVYRWAKRDVIEKEREDWKRISMALRTAEHILKYDPLTIRDLIQQRPEDIHKNPVALNEYISNFLAKNGIYENEAEQEKTTATDTLDASATEAGSVETKHTGDESGAGTMETTPQVETERQGPFYYRSATGDKIGRANKLQKLEEVLSQGCIEISQEEYQARKKGTYKDDAGQSATDNKELPAVCPGRAAQLEKELNDAFAKDTASEQHTKIEKIGDGVFSIENLLANSAAKDQNIDVPEDNRQAMTERQTEIAHVLNDLFSGRSDIIGKEEADGILSCTGHLPPQIVGMLIDTFVTAESQLSTVLSDEELHDVGTTAVDAWSDNEAERLKIVTDAIVEYRSEPELPQPAVIDPPVITAKPKKS
ncbi:exonuclease [Enterobacter asburiae]|uniref:exonuclease n=1 Tax=Enterobacter asburiae TaxID=61645 RepID=UPI0015754A11|nr:exonuclease [Enterobacter asburiae]NQF31002.1 exonuclease [Enterobacter asburiae]